MRVLLQRRFRGNRNPAHLQEEEGTEDLQNEEELELEQEESSILELNPASVQLSVESRKYQQQEELLAQPPEFSAKGSNEAKLQQQHSSSPSFRKRRAPKENSNINNCKRSSRHTTEEPPLLLDTKPRARETNYIVRNPESSLDSSPEGLASAKPEAVSTSNTRGETTNIFKSTNNNNNNNRKMVSGGGGRNHHYHHNRSFRRQEEEEEHLNSAYGILNQHRQRHGLRLANAVRRRTDDNEPERYVEQQHLENDPASARGDIASSSPERENYNNFNRISELSSSATSVGDGSFVVLGREEPLLLESTSSLSTRMSSVPRTASMPVNSNFNNNNDRKRAPVEDIIRCGTESIDDLTAEEFRFRDVLKRERGLEIEEVDGDGNCLFRAISLQVYGDTTMHADVRQQCMDYMERDQEHFSQFVTGEPFFRYVARTRQDGVHGNNPEIQASSELFNRPIEVFTPQNGSAPLNIFHAEYKTGDVPIRLSYHDGNHYNAVIDPLAPTAGLGLGLPDLQPPGYADKMQMDKAMAESMNAKDEMELQQVMESSRREYQHQTGSDYNNKDSDDELQRAIKESRLSAEHVSLIYNRDLRRVSSSKPFCSFPSKVIN